MAKQQTKQKVKLRQTLTAQNKLTFYLDWSKENRRNVTHTTKYIRVAEELKKKAVNSIPTLNF